MLLQHPIETKDLILRSIDASFAIGPYVAWMQDANITRFLEVRFAPPDQAALVAFIVKMNESPDNLLLGLFPKSASDRHIGNIKLGPIDRRHKSAAIGIAIGVSEFWGKGFAAQAVAVVSEHAFTALGLDRVEAGFYADNVSSQRAFLHAGFQEEGRRRGARLCDGVRVDEVVMGRLRA